MGRESGSGPRGVNHGCVIDRRVSYRRSHTHPHALPLRTALCHSLRLAASHSPLPVPPSPFSPPDSSPPPFLPSFVRLCASPCCLSYFPKPPPSLSTTLSVRLSFPLADGCLKPSLLSRSLSLSDHILGVCYGRRIMRHFMRAHASYMFLRCMSRRGFQVGFSVSFWHKDVLYHFNR